jgi:lipid-A-disaccharide synthase
LMLCIFPFEAELYNQSGLRTIFVGHPMIDKLRAQTFDRPRDANLIGLFPGSRQREIRKIFPLLLKTAFEIKARDPDIRFEIAAASQPLADEMQKMLAPSPIKAAFQLTRGEAALTMQRAFAGIVASGSATLEAAFFRMPFVLVYKVSWLTYLAARLVVKVKYLGMPNVLAGKEIVPEFIQGRARPRAMAEAVLKLKNNPAARTDMVSEFDNVIAGLGQGSASATAAKAIIEEV